MQGPGWVTGAGPRPDPGCRARRTPLDPGWARGAGSGQGCRAPVGAGAELPPAGATGRLGPRAAAPWGWGQWDVPALGTGALGHPCPWADTVLSPSQLAHLAGMPPEPGTMDAPPITPGELLCLGSSLAFSGLFYYLYRKKARVVARIQVALSLRCSLLPTVPSPLPCTARHRAFDLGAPR